MTHQYTKLADELDATAGNNSDMYEHERDSCREAARILRAAAAVDVQLNVVAYRDGGTKRCSVTAPAYWVRPEPMVYLSEATEALIQKDLKIAALESALRLSLAAREWQPIETAPKDEQILLATEFDRPGDWRIKAGYFYEDTGQWRVWGASWTPTRWMPLPAAPKGTYPQEDRSKEPPCHACGLGYKCRSANCPNTTPDPDDWAAPKGTP